MKERKFEKHNQNRCSQEREEDQIGNSKAKENRVKQMFTGKRGNLKNIIKTYVHRKERKIRLEIVKLKKIE